MPETRLADSRPEEGGLGRWSDGGFGRGQRARRRAEWWRQFLVLCSWYFVLGVVGGAMELAEADEDTRRSDTRHKT